MKKICTGVASCGKEKKISEFNFNKKSKDRRANRCRECNILYFSAYRVKNGEKLKLNNKIWRTENSEIISAKQKAFRTNNPDKTKKHKRKSRIRNIHQTILSQCANTAKYKNIEFALKKEDIVIPKRCPVFNIKLKIAEDYPTDNSPSVDRIDNYAKAKNIIIPFNLTNESFNYPTHCPILGLELDRNIGQPGPNSPSIDRINNKKGYIVGNIRIISYRANELKNNASYTVYKSKRL